MLQMFTLCASSPSHIPCSIVLGSYIAHIRRSMYTPFTGDPLMPPPVYRLCQTSRTHPLSFVDASSSTVHARAASSQALGTRRRRNSRASACRRLGLTHHIGPPSVRARRRASRQLLFAVPFAFLARYLGPFAAACLHCTLHRRARVGTRNRVRDEK
jgi:hypothetical protein